MSSIKFRIADDVLKDFPELEIRALRVSGLAAATRNIDAASLVEQGARHVALTLTQETLMADPRIVAWRQAYQRIKAKPSRFRSSIEALARRAVKQGSLTTGIGAVDAYNGVSLMNMAPLGAYDAARLPQGEMLLRHVDPATDSFTPLGAAASDFPLHPGLVAYVLGSKVLCWGFNCRDSSDTCLTAETDEGLFFGEAAFDVHREGLAKAMERLKSVFSEAGATCGDVQIANAGSAGFEV